MTSQWPDTEDGTEVVVLCPTCGIGEIAYDELVPRSLGMNVVRRKDGKLAAEPDGLKYDECAWEGSMTEGLICPSCAMRWEPEEDESIEELLARIGIVKTPEQVADLHDAWPAPGTMDCATCGQPVESDAMAPTCFRHRADVAECVTCDADIDMAAPNHDCLA
jgi:hypothetical protein